jgi:fused signal recognition particle receptor
MMTILDKLKMGLSKTREQVFDQIHDVIFFARSIDDDLLGEIEDLLILGDVGVDAATEIIDRLQKQVKKKNYSSTEQLYGHLKEIIVEILESSTLQSNEVLPQPYIIFIVGVNGTGKTTSIAKLASRYKKNGKKVMLVAADTFRAAAIDQLQIWSDRIGTEMIRHQEGADPSAVVFDSLQAAVSRQFDVVIIDTAGRLHTKINLMEELKKMKRVIQKLVPEAPHQSLLVLDATTGQNAISQAKQFIETVKVDGIVLAKLDGTAKGGVVIGISHQLKLPVLYVGLGEKLDDFAFFDPKLFVEGLLK